MITVVPFTAAHFRKINEQDAQVYLRPYFSDAAVERIERGGKAYCLLDSETGRPLCVGGITEFWPGRGEAWMIFDRDCRRQFVAIFNFVRRFLENSPIRRIESAVDVDFKQAHRWMRLLGFKLEAAHRPGYLPNGGDCALYARVKA